MTDQSFEKDNQNLNEAIMSLKTSDARKTTFADQLSNEEKVYFVESRLNSLKEDLNLDEEQIAVINELKPFLKPELYVIGSELNQKALKYSPEWREKAIKFFSKDQLEYIFSFRSLKEFKSAVKTNRISNIAAAGGEGSDCDCSTQSDWCSGGDCGGPQCAFQSYACGTLFLYHCDGLCV